VAQTQIAAGNTVQDYSPFRHVLVPLDASSLAGLSRPPQSTAPCWRIAISALWPPPEAIGTRLPLVRGCAVQCGGYR
jgi:hypothetical protein